MAQGTTQTFGKQYFLLGDGATPTENFAAPCGMTELGLQVNTETQTVNVPDCADPDLPGWLEADIVSQQMTLTGNGVLTIEAVETWRDWWFNDGGSLKNVQWFRNFGAGNGGGTFEGPAVLSAYAERGSKGGRWQIEVQIIFSGKPGWTPQV